MNMSYCRWQNTEIDLRDCKNDLEERVNGEARDELSREEFEAACQLLRRAQSMLGAIREAVDVYGEADLTLDQIRDGLAKIEEGAQRYAEPDGDEPTEEELKQYAQDEAERAERAAGWDRNP